MPSIKKGDIDRIIMEQVSFKFEQKFSETKEMVESVLNTVKNLSNKRSKLRTEGERFLMSPAHIHKLPKVVSRVIESCKEYAMYGDKNMLAETSELLRELEYNGIQPMKMFIDDRIEYNKRPDIKRNQYNEKEFQLTEESLKKMDGFVKVITKIRQEIMKRLDALEKLAREQDKFVDKLKKI